MLSSLVWIVLIGFLAGQLVAKLKAPPLLGMILWGIAIGPQGLNQLSPDFLRLADDLRIIAVMVILAKAGLGLDYAKLRQQGTVALRLGFLPAAFEMVVVAIASHFIFKFDIATGLLLGCILGAESPAVIVPGMLFLKSRGWGVQKGIPDAILTGSALSDVLLLLLFNLLLSFVGGQHPVSQWHLFGINPIWLLPIQVIVLILAGVGVGFVAARLLNALLSSSRWTQTTTQDTLMTAGVSLALIVAASQLPLFSGYLAVMTLGFWLGTYQPPLARRLRQGFDSLWAIAQIILFVLLGAAIQLDLLLQLLLPGLLILALGTLIGRGLGWALATWGSNWNIRERLFLVAGNSAKATVQAAIGAIPLSLGVPGGETILALSALSILVTAPLGAWAIPFVAPKLLTRDPVDPTKVSVIKQLHLLVAVDGSDVTPFVLEKAAEIARLSDGRITVLHVFQEKDQAILEDLPQQVKKLLADIPHDWMTSPGEVAPTIVETAIALHADQIVVGRQQSSNPYPIGSVSQTVLEQSPIPTVVMVPY